MDKNDSITLVSRDQLEAALLDYNELDEHLLNWLYPVLYPYATQVIKVGDLSAILGRAFALAELPLRLTDTPTTIKSYGLADIFELALALSGDNDAAIFACSYFENLSVRP